MISRVIYMNLSKSCEASRTFWVGFYVGVGKAGYVFIFAVIGRSRGRIFNALFGQWPIFYLSMDIGGMPGAGRLLLLNIGG